MQIDCSGASAAQGRSGGASRWAWLVATSVALLAPWCSADAQQSAVDYLRDIKPLLKERCFACHGSLKQQSALRLDTAALMLKGGDGGVVVAPGEPTKSTLIERIESKDDAVRMPPEGHPLKPEQIATLKAWIAQGAKGPENEKPEKDPRDHWAFRKPVRAAPPALKNADSKDAAAPNPIDAFLLARLESEGLAPQPLAPKHVQLRRVTLDLIGLPPTPDELRSFLADESPDAYEKAVDRLLADPRHGERWARHWMDVWRYADWYGRRHVPDVWNSAPQIWRWRDWIVRSLNEDRGYDRMLREMLAADEVAPEDDEAGYATGYLIRNWYALNPNDWMRNTVEHTGKAFLGLTLNCAHCHDHKYDPITQDEYFRFRAFFEPISIRQDRVAGEADPGPFQEYDYGKLRKIQRLGAVRIYDKTPDAPTWFYTGGDERNRVKDRGSIAPGTPAFLSAQAGGLQQAAPQAVTLPARAYYPGLRPAIQQTALADARAAVVKAEAELAAAKQSATEPPAELRDQLAKAEAAYDAARKDAEAGRQPGALGGKQSLLLDAKTGRRNLINGLTSLKELPDGATLSFQLLILTDALVNFQFAKDTTKGLTAGYVAFEKGRIVSYQPGGFNEFEAGKYDFAAGQSRFAVTLVIQTKADRCLLGVRSMKDDKTLVEAVPVALNGWNPVGDATKAISFDARTGSVAVIDDVVLSPPVAVADAGSVGAVTARNQQDKDGTTTEPTALGPRVTVAADAGSVGHETGGKPLVAFRFEPPVYTDGRDAAGIEGWIASSYNVAPATSVVSSSAGNETLRDLARAVETARRAARTPMLPLLAAEARVAATKAERASVEARVAADNARYGALVDEVKGQGDRGAEGQDASSPVDRPPTAPLPPSSPAPALLAAAASRAERAAAILTARADVVMQERSLAATEAKPMTDANRAKELAAATTALAAAQAVEAKALAAQSDAKLDATYTAFSPTYPQTSTGRRKALAEWITSPDNPLTARVAVNHIWSRHFHVPLVTTVHDFGRNGAPPTHPELLDWLALQLMGAADRQAGAAGQGGRGIEPGAEAASRENRPSTNSQPTPLAGSRRTTIDPLNHPSSARAAPNPEWRMKRLHRLIVTSDAYRRTSSAAAITHSPPRPAAPTPPLSVAPSLRPSVAPSTTSPPGETPPPPPTSPPAPGALAAAAAKDPENQWLWRMNAGRMEAEVVRDSLLALGEALDAKLGGQELENAEALTTRRRSLYYSVFPEEGGMSKLGELFDAPNPLECYRRTRTIVPQQALALTNSDLVHDMAAAIVRIEGRFSDAPTGESRPATGGAPTTLADSRQPATGSLDDATFIKRVFERVLNRAPTAAEQALCAETLHLDGVVGAAAPPAAALSADARRKARESLVRSLLNHNDFVTIR